MGHEKRAHALLSASSAHRWLVCTPSARLEEQFPDTESGAAREGTLAHELAELKLRNYFFTVDFGKTKLARAIGKLKKEELWNDEMMGYTDTYLDYVKSTALGFKNIPTARIEARIEFDAWVPEGFGTADCILIGGGILHVIDFKYGKWVAVSAEGNPQMALYALGAYEAFKILYPVETIRMSIVQPRIGDGISEWECSLKELLAFGEYVKRKAVLALEGRGEFVPDEKACRFCRAKGRCRARSEEKARLAFSPGYGKKPPLISNGEIGEYLRQGIGVAKWVSDLQETALKECLAGKEVPGWKAVEGRGSREWKDPDAAFKTLAEGGIDEALLWERRPVTPPALEKILGKKEFKELAAGCVVQKPGKPALVQESDSRPAVTDNMTAKEAFKETEGIKNE